jgi:L-lactate dehydrogenase complex protein LldG
MSTSTPLPDSRPARSAILNTLRRAAPPEALPVPSLAPYHASAYGRGMPGHAIDPAELIGPFEQAARGWRAEVLHATPSNWPGAVRAALDARGLQHIAIGAASPLQPGLDAALAGLAVRRYTDTIEAWKHELFEQIQAGVTACAAGIADTGTLVLRPGPGEPRTLSLVPPLHIAVLRASTLQASLPAAMAVLQPQADMPTNLLLVTGPSKTADIQQVLAFGAHGPKELVIVLINDLPAAASGSDSEAR